jgi:methionine-rich copper-binding protein CopC
MMTRKTASTFAAFSLAVAAMLSGQAMAHAKLVKADPADGGVAKAGASDIDLAFSEEISGKMSGAVITDAAGRTVPSAAMMEKDPKVMMVMTKTPLAPGAYTVTWHAVASDDGHKTTGVYSFTVK